MNIKDATPEQKLRALAELDGWDADSIKPCSIEPDCDCWKSGLPQYLTSYDAIIPLIQKLPYEVRQKSVPKSFALLPYDFAPSQLCDAVLVATGKFEV